jgi:hypothetical protein
MKRAPILHPFFFALFPILALYAHNFKSIPYPLKELAGPLIVSLACAIALFVLLRAIVKDPAKAGLIVSLFALWFLSFGHLAGQIAVLTEGIYNRSLFFATALLVGVGGFLIVRSRRTFGGLTRVLNAVAVTLVVFNVFTTAQTLARRPHAAPAKEVRVSGQATARPNIYYIILDAYTRADILKEVFSFDNSGVLAGLEKRGFVVADRSYANYSLTQQSLASSLNFMLLDSWLRTSDTLPPTASSLCHDPGNGPWPFKAQGYRLITTSSSIEPTDFASRPVLRFCPIRFRVPRCLFGTTLPLFAKSKAGHSPYDAHRGGYLTSSALEESPMEKGPFFMFVHVMAPHPPFVFGADGEAVEPDYLFSMVDADRLHGGNSAALPDYIARYRAQLAFLNAKILHALDSILGGSPEPPIIVLQGDHGSRTYTDLDRPEASYFKENLAILNAYHLPGDGRSLVYPSISPVNTFRLIFKRYFGAELDLLEDGSFWTTWRRPYRFHPFDEAHYEATVGSVRDEMKPEAPATQKR